MHKIYKYLENNNIEPNMHLWLLFTLIDRNSKTQSIYGLVGVKRYYSRPDQSRHVVFFPLDIYIDRSFINRFSIFGSTRCWLFKRL